MFGEVLSFQYFKGLLVFVIECSDGQLVHLFRITPDQLCPPQAGDLPMTLGSFVLPLG